MSMFTIPHDRLVRIRVEKTNNLHWWQAWFDWNDGELSSKDDYEVPTVGQGASVVEAIGNLIVNHNEGTR